MFLKRQSSAILKPKQRAGIVTLYIENSRSVMLAKRANAQITYGDIDWPPSSPDFTHLGFFYGVI